MGGIVGKLLPVLKGAQLGSEYNIISYRFQYPSMWDRETKFYREMEKLLTEGTASFKLIGGIPLEEHYISNLIDLQKKGAEVRILEKPPTSHVFIRDPAEREIELYFDIKKGKFIPYVKNAFIGLN